MKANEAPEKIYLQICGNCNDNDCEHCKFEDLEDDVTWSKDKIFDKDVEYTRTDAIIEKAEKWLNENQKGWILDDEDITEFINYMKGE